MLHKKDLVADGGDDEEVAKDAKEGEAHLKQNARHNLHVIHLLFYYHSFKFRLEKKALWLKKKASLTD